MFSRGELQLVTPDEVRDPAFTGLDVWQRQALVDVCDWAGKFLSRPNTELGRIGPVCPYTRTAIDAQLFFLACPRLDDMSFSSLRDTVQEYRDWFLDLRDLTTDEQQHLLTILIVLPDFDAESADELDRLHASLKDDFVGAGLMVGQFHPKCQQSGLWNDQFRPLQAPVPLFAIREMVSSDLPFLVTSDRHAAVYLDRFAKDMPAHTRRFLVDRIVGKG